MELQAAGASTMHDAFDGEDTEPFGDLRQRFGHHRSHGAGDLVGQPGEVISNARNVSPVALVPLVANLGDLRVHQLPQALAVIAGVRKAVDQGADRGERRVQLAGAGIGALVATTEQLRRDALDVCQAERGTLGHMSGPVEPVRVGVERSGEVAKMRRVDADSVEHADRPAHQLVGQQFGKEHVPALVERHLRSDLVERLD